MHKRPFGAHGGMWGVSNGDSGPPVRGCDPGYLIVKKPR
jgi:hypothetical protein